MTLEPSRSEAEKFLAALDPSPDAQWCFQTFTDDKQKRKARAEENKLRKKQGKTELKDPLAAWRYGTLADHWSWLVKQNARGAGIYVTVNETDGNGRKKTNIRRIRALFADLDGAPIEPVNNAELKSQITMESSPNRYQAYWCFSGRMPLKVFEPLQMEIAARFKSDPSVHDLSRVMRLPGFVHRKEKDRPFLSHIVAVNGVELPHASVLLRTFRPAKKKKDPPPPPPPPPRDDELPEQWKKLNTEAIRRYDDWVPSIFPSATRTSEGGYRVSSADLGRDLEEDLSFHRDGIKDFGVHDMGDWRRGKRTPIDIVEQYLHKDFTEAVRWLAQRLGLDPRDYLPKGKSTGDPALDAEIERLAKLSRVDYDREREAAAKKLGIRKTTLDELAEEKKTSKPKPGGKEYMTVFSDLACNVGNVLLALNQEPGLMNAFGYDEMLRTEVLLRPLRKEQNFKVRPVTDADVTAMQSWLQWYGFRGLGKDAAHDAVNKHARDHAFHPVRDYLNRLKWDKKLRLATWLHEYLDAEENKYTGSIGTMFLIGMVARIFEPGCKFDYMPILEGEQGLNKSKACSILAGPEYFSDQLPDIKSKEASQHLRGKWLIEVAELSTYSRAAVDDFKAFLTRQVERYRPPWGRKEVHEPRQCAFIGTTNKVHYFRDETGNRRFWPATTGGIKLDKLHDDRDQLFAEAVQLFRNKVHWWPDRKFELDHIAPEQESRYEPDVWEPLIRNYLDGLIEQALKAQPTSYLPRTTILDIATEVLGFTTADKLAIDEIKTPISRLEPKTQGRIRAVLTHLHWVPKRTNQERWWEPSPKVLSEG
jgi:predicted P-loop ATPase